MPQSISNTLEEKDQAEKREKARLKALEKWAAKEEKLAKKERRPKAGRVPPQLQPKNAVVVEVPAEAAVLAVKRAVAAKTQIAADRQMLMAGGSRAHVQSRGRGEDRPHPACCSER